MSFTDYVTDSIKSTARRVYEDAEDRIAESVHYHASVIQRKLIKGAAFAAMMLGGLIFITLSLIFFLVEYAGIGYSASFLIGALILFLIGGILKIS
jgi:hypothetical protein